MPFSDRLMVWDLNDYWLSLSDFSTAIGYDVTGSAVKPFFPAQEEPESVEPFIVYDNMTEISPRDWWMWRDIVLYQIYSKDILTTAKLTNIILDYIKAGAESAWLINDWARVNGRNDYTFKSIELLELADIKPADAEYGVRTRMISMRVQYTPNEGLGLGNIPELPSIPAGDVYGGGY